MLADRLAVLRALLKAFQNIDDPYVSQRLYVAAYGCALCTEDLDELSLLAQQVYDEIFSSGSPPVDIVLRDAAKGIIQIAVARGVHLKINFERVLPPYQTAWIGRLPTLAALEKRIGDWGKTDEQRGARLLMYSVVHDDFGRYELNDLDMWAPRRLGKKSKPSPMKVFADFEDSLSQSQCELLQQIERAHSAHFRRGFSQLIFGDQPQISTEEIQKLICEFEKSLDDKQHIIFRQQILKMFLGSGRPYTDARFDKTVLQRWIIHRALSLGWNKRLFGAFDSRVRSEGREAHKPERIGKKYQWIALHEFYARLSDNYEFSADAISGPSKEKRKDGSWTNQFRDIDASLLLRSTPLTKWGPNYSAWWTGVPYDDWFCKSTKLAWLKSRSDLPNPATLLQVINPADGSEWYLLEGFIKRSREEQIGTIKTSEGETQEVWFMFKSYLVSQKDFSTAWQWAGTQRWMGGWMPESHMRLRVWLREHYFPPQFSWPLADEWETGYGYDSKLPSPMLLTNDEYGCESGTHDCSVDETVLITLPARSIVHGMQLRMDGRRGKFVDSSGTVIAFDPSVDEAGPGALLIRKEPFLNYLSTNSLRIFWTVLGEKNIYPPGFGSRENWLGRSELNGAYRISDGKIEGQVRLDFIQGGSTTDEEISGN